MKIVAILLAVITLLCGCGTAVETTAPDTEGHGSPASDTVITEPDITGTELPVESAVGTEAPETEPPVERTDFTIEVKEDAYVINASGGKDLTKTNYGSEPLLEVKTTPSMTQLVRYAYLKFDISALAGDDDFTCIDLDLDVVWHQNDGFDAKVDVYGCGTKWSEGGLTYGTRLSPDGFITSNEHISPKLGIHSFSVTDYIRQAIALGKTEVAFYIKEATETAQHIKFSSREGEGEAPTLKIYYGTKNDSQTYEGEWPAEPVEPAKTIPIIADTYVLNSDSTGDAKNKNFGSDTELHLKSNNGALTRYSYFKLDISSLAGDGNFTCVDLDLCLAQRETADFNGKVALYACSADWEENELTYSTMPKNGELITSNGKIGSEKGEIYSFSITDYIRQALANGQTEIAVCAVDATEEKPLHIRFASRESGENGPKLSVYYGNKIDTQIFGKENVVIERSESGLDSIVGLRKRNTVEIVATEDTYIEAGKSADKNFGDNELLDFKAMPNGKATEYYRIILLKFDISQISDTDFEQANLMLNCTLMQENDIPTNMELYGCFPYDWEEMSVTYNTRPEREDLITVGIARGNGAVSIDITQYLKRCINRGDKLISFYIEGDVENCYRLQFSSNESLNVGPRIEISSGEASFTTELAYKGENPWQRAMEQVSEWLNRWAVIKQGGDDDAELVKRDDSEYSFTVDATSSPNGYKTTYKKYPTRSVSTLNGYTPDKAETAKYDIYGGLMDESLRQEATGFYYTTKIGDRWWTIDPLGYPFYRVACVQIGMGNAKPYFLAKYGTEIGWAQGITDRFKELGFNSTGGWSSISLLSRANEPLSQTNILYVLKDYCESKGLDVTVSGHTQFLNDVMPVFDPDFEAFARNHVEKATSAYANDPNIYGWMSDNELPGAPTMLDTSLSLDVNDERNAYTYATAWTFMYLKTGKTEPTLDDITAELRNEYFAMVYDRYYSVVCDALQKAVPNHQYIGCRLIGNCYKNEYVIRVSGYWCDIISFNYYGAWNADPELVCNIQKWAGKPFIVTEWYAKGMDVFELDNRMTNESGAGWVVRNQEDRGKFYQNFALSLLETKGCVGFDWFQLMDNDPDNLKADLSNRNSNKGIFNIKGEEYTDLTKYMGDLNNQKYNLISFFDKRS